jgi:hypothetical protein
VSAIKNLKGVLTMFERMSGMRINFHKTELTHLKDRIHAIAH